MPASLHNHTPLCGHAEGTPEAYVDAAIAAGLDAFGVSEHAPVLPEPFDDWRMRMADLPAYLDWVDRARDHAADRIRVRCGLECDWFDTGAAWIETLAGKHDWDHLIGAVHYLDGWNFDHPEQQAAWSSADVSDVWTRYWRTVARMADSGLFDIIAHPDLIKKFGHHPSGDLNRWYEPTIDAIAASGCAIELNTAGWEKPCAEAYPSPTFLELACSAGIPLVISSDGHAPHEVARGFPRGIEVARAAGYRETCDFEGRRRVALPL